MPGHIMPKMEMPPEKLSLEKSWREFRARGEVFNFEDEFTAFKADAQKFIKFFSQNKKWQDNLPKGIDAERLKDYLQNLKFYISLSREGISGLAENKQISPLETIAYVEMAYWAITNNKNNIEKEVQDIFPDYF